MTVECWLLMGGAGYPHAATGSLTYYTNTKMSHILICCSLLLPAEQDGCGQAPVGRDPGCWQADHC